MKIYWYDCWQCHYQKKYKTIPKNAHYDEKGKLCTICGICGVETYLSTYDEKIPQKTFNLTSYRISDIMSISKREER